MENYLTDRSCQMMKYRLIVMEALPDIIECLGRGAAVQAVRGSTLPNMVVKEFYLLYILKLFLYTIYVLKCVYHKLPFIHCRQKSSLVKPYLFPFYSVESHRPLSRQLVSYTVPYFSATCSSNPSVLIL